MNSVRMPITKVCTLVQAGMRHDHNVTAILKVQLLLSISIQLPLGFLR